MTEAAGNAVNMILARSQAAQGGERIAYPQGAILLEPKGRTTHILFPISMVASFVRSLKDGSTVEVGIVGPEGVIGTNALFDATAQPNEVTAQVPGEAIRIPFEAAKRAFDNDSEFRQLVLRFANAFTVQIGQTAACNRLHPLERRLARWLLMVNDRAKSDSMIVTQEFLGQMLGTRTAGVNEAVSALTASGLIRHRRNIIEVIDREGLEAAACECYRVVRSLYERDKVM